VIHASYDWNHQKRARIPAITPSGEFRRSIETGDIIGSKAHGRIRVRRTVFADRMHNGRKVER